MQVRVMYRNSFEGGDGWTYYPVEVEIGDNCPICGEKRGVPRMQSFCYDGDWYGLSTWSNPCGHIDTYKDVLIEAGYIKKSMG